MPGERRYEMSRRAACPQNGPSYARQTIRQRVSQFGTVGHSGTKGCTVCRPEPTKQSPRPLVYIPIPLQPVPRIGQHGDCETQPSPSSHPPRSFSIANSAHAYLVAHRAPLLHRSQPASSRSVGYPQSPGRGLIRIVTSRCRSRRLRRGTHPGRAGSGAGQHRTCQRTCQLN